MYGTINMVLNSSVITRNNYQLPIIINVQYAYTAYDEIHILTNNIHIKILLRIF